MANGNRRETGKLRRDSKECSVVSEQKAFALGRSIKEGGFVYYL